MAKIEAKPGTDIWRKPPSADIFNAPTYRPVSNPLRRFKSATVTFRASYTQLYDQAGLLFSFKDKSSSTNTASPSPVRWIKAGVEFYKGKPLLSTVCCENYADWSVSTLPTAGTVSSITYAKDVEQGHASVTVSVEKDNDEHGVSWWVYHVAEDGTKTPMREICWIYADESGRDWEVEVSGLVARPSKDAKGTLSAEFEKFDVQWKD